jgi:hypothetical protein
VISISSYLFLQYFDESVTYLTQKSINPQEGAFSATLASTVQKSKQTRRPEFLEYEVVAFCPL